MKPTEPSPTALHKKLSRFHRAGSAIERILRDAEELRYELRMNLRFLDQIENPSVASERKADVLAAFLRQIEKTLPFVYSLIPREDRGDSWMIPLPKIRRWQVLPKEQWSAARHKREMRRAVDAAERAENPNFDEDKLVSAASKDDERMLQRIGFKDAIPGRWWQRDDD